MLTCTWTYCLLEVDGAVSSGLNGPLTPVSFTILLRWLKTCFEVVIPPDSMPRHGRCTCITIDSTFDFSSRSSIASSPPNRLSNLDIATVGP